MLKIAVGAKTPASMLKQQESSHLQLSEDTRIAFSKSAESLDDEED